MKIKEISAYPIYDTRGELTLEIKVLLENGLFATASVPQGKSLGKGEALYLNPQDKYLPSILKEIINPLLKGKDPRDQNEIDHLLIEEDGTVNKANLGANLILGISLACLKLGSLLTGVPLFKYIRSLLWYKEENQKFPRFLMNLINGGKHSFNNLTFQEYLIVPLPESPSVQIANGIKVFKELVMKFPSAPMGDEAGLAPNFENSWQPFQVLSELIKKVNLESFFKFGLDAAGNSFYSDQQKKYLYDNQLISGEDLLKIYEAFLRQFPVVYLEDPFFEEDQLNFQKITTLGGGTITIAGDDLTVTHPEKIQKAVKNRLINGVIIKPNQIGTITETLSAIKIAKENGLKIIISHRSGETEENWIAHLAFAVQAWGVKLGCPLKDRIFKYNEFLRIERIIS